MLYNPKWEKKTEVILDPMTLPAFIAWLEKQPPEKAYDFLDCDGGCLVDQYIGRNTTGTEYSAIPKQFRMIAAGHPRTFGGALERALAQ